MRWASDSIVGGIRRAWALIDPNVRRHLRALTLLSVLIACLDTVALLLIYGLVTLLSGSGQDPAGVAGSLMRALAFGVSDHFDRALVLLAISSVLFMVRTSLAVLNMWFVLGELNTAEADLLRRLLVGHALSPYVQRIERNSSEMLRTLSFSVDQVNTGVVGSSVAIISNVAITLASAAAIFLSSPLVGLTVTAYFAVISIAWTRGVKGAMRRRGEGVQSLQEERYRLVMHGLGAAKELQLRGRATFYAETAVGTTRRINSAMRGVACLNYSLRSMLETSLVTGTLLVVVVADATGGRASTLPAVGLVLAAALRLLPALNQVVSLSNSVQYNMPAIALLERELANFDDAPAPAQHADHPISFDRELRLRDVSFRYRTRSRDALHGIDLTIRPGERVGIVGPTGSGKSTLLDVLLGVLEPTTGDVLLDGAPLSERREAWQRSIGYVPQDVYLVDDTVRANVALGWRGSDVDDDAVADAVRVAELDEVVADLPEGLETRLGERGVRLSGGQRQRIGIARALYTRPKVLVLDEATSNLDRETEARIVDTLARIGGGVTMVVVTHRTASVRHCDRIVCIEGGAIQADGTLAEVFSLLPEIFDDHESAGSTTATAPIPR